MGQMGREAGIGQVLEQLSFACPSGFAIALHIKFTSPRYLFQAYSKDWIDYYSAHGLVMRDPTVQWGFENTGHMRWSALAGPADPVMQKAAEYGLDFGFTTALVQSDSRSVASFARADREFTDIEISEIEEMVTQMHHDTLTAEVLSPDDHLALKRLSILLTRS
jgi:LuxR family transcriptional regulator, quorum-sensing system regulator SdiA